MNLMHHSDAGVGTTLNLDRMYARYSYLKLKKKLGGLKWGKTSIFGAFLMFFVHISKTSQTILMEFCV